MKFSEIWAASRWSIGLGIFLAFLQFLVYVAIDLFSLALNLIQLLSLGVWAVSLLLFFLIYVHLAHKSAKKFKMDALSTEITVAFASGIIGSIDLVFHGVRSLLSTLGLLGTSAINNSSAAALGVMGAAGLMGIGFGILCSIGLLFCSIVLNLIIGGIFGLIWQVKSSPMVNPPSETEKTQIKKSETRAKPLPDGGEPFPKKSTKLRKK